MSMLVRFECGGDTVAVVAGGGVGLGIRSLESFFISSGIRGT